MPAPLLPGGRLSARRRNLQRGRIAIIFLVAFLLAIGFYHRSSASAPSLFRKRARQIGRAHPEQRYNHGDAPDRTHTPSPSRPKGPPAVRENRPNAFLNHEKSWQGWDHMTHIFAFGDGHLETGFNPDGPQPSRDNPLGNPPFPGRTRGYGPNWLSHLTGTNNESLILTYNYARDGATLEKKSDDLFSTSLPQQIEKYFVARHGLPSREAGRETRQARDDWKSATSMFVFGFGSDEIVAHILDMEGKRDTAMLQHLVDVYIAGLRRMYDYGARNLLVSNVPAFDGSPTMRLTDKLTKSMIQCGNIIVEFNARLAFALHGLAYSLPDANFWLFDAERMTLQVRADPQRHKETAAYKHTEGFCYLYADEWNLRENLDTNQAACDGRLDEYYWRDTIHMTEPLHRLHARLVVHMLQDRSALLPCEDW